MLSDRDELVLDGGLRVPRPDAVLIGSAWKRSADRERGLALARRLRAGSVAIDTFGPTMAAPFGGVKRSGWGRECGPEGIREFSDTKQILLG